MEHENLNAPQNPQLNIGAVSSSYVPIKDRHGALYLIPKERQSEFENDFAVRHIGNKKTDKWCDYRCR